MACCSGLLAALRALGRAPAPTAASSRPPAAAPTLPLPARCAEKADWAAVEDWVEDFASTASGLSGSGDMLCGELRAMTEAELPFTLPREREQQAPPPAVPPAAWAWADAAGVPQQHTAASPQRLEPEPETPPEEVKALSRTSSTGACSGGSREQTEEMGAQERTLRGQALQGKETGVLLGRRKRGKEELSGSRQRRQPVCEEQTVLLQDTEVRPAGRSLFSCTACRTCHKEAGSKGGEQSTLTGSLHPVMILGLAYDPPQQTLSQEAPPPVESPSVANQATLTWGNRPLFH